MTWDRIVIIVFIGVSVCAAPSWARREAFSPEQRDQLAKAQTVLVEALAITEQGTADAKGLIDLLAKRMSELGYTVVTDVSKPHDVAIRVKCEQKKTWEGTTASGGDADLPDSPSRIWKGPACQLNYFLGTTKIKWQKEVRTDFEDATEAAKKANAADPGAFAIGTLQQQLERYDFPVVFAAEWGQVDRLLALLDKKGPDQMRLLKVMSLLGDMQADEALPRLQELMKDRKLAGQAIEAMGNAGKESIPTLIDLMKTSKDVELQAAAAKALGHVGGMNGDPSIILPLLEMLDAPGIDIAVQTEVAWALGKLPDKRAEEPLKALDRKLQKIRDPDNIPLKKLKEAVFWSIKQIDTYDMFS
jgi:hypothetical protein